MDWKRLFSYNTSSLERELLLQNEYLLAENKIFRNQIQGRLQLTDGERKTLAEIGKRLGRKGLTGVATVANPDTILGWHRKLIANTPEFLTRKRPGRPKVDPELEALILRIAHENKS